MGERYIFTIERLTKTYGKQRITRPGRRALRLQQIGLARGPRRATGRAGRSMVPISEIGPNEKALAAIPALPYKSEHIPSGTIARTRVGHLRREAAQRSGGKMSATETAAAVELDRDTLLEHVRADDADPHVRGSGRQELRRRARSRVRSSLRRRGGGRGRHLLPPDRQRLHHLAPTAVTATASPRASTSPAWSPS